MPGLRAFTDASVWNLPADELQPHPRSDEIIRFLRDNNSDEGCIKLAGADDGWGMPIYWVAEDDPVHEVTSSRYDLPAEFARLRIPGDARPSRNADAEMVLIDLHAGYVVSLSKARYDPAEDRWSAGGGSVAYLASNGLDARVAGSDDRRNAGSHRGLNGAVMAVRLDEIEVGSVDHVLKVAVAKSARRMWVPPMTGTDGRSKSDDAPPQGTRIRLRPDLDLDEFELHPQARVIAEALQRYGAIIGDSSGGGIALKLEEPTGSAAGVSWEIGEDALCGIPITAFEAVAP